MHKIIDILKNKLPEQQSGFVCRKSQDVYIPYLEIGIECLIRDVSEINLFFETILKLIELEINDISEIATILGISFEIVKEAIVDMVEADYIGVSENNLRITKKGKETLKIKQLIEIKRKYINQVIIDLITGEIKDGSDIKGSRINKYDVCLAQKINVNKAFLDSNFSNINRVFQKQQENNSALNKKQTNKELYKIIDISYDNLVYIKNEIYIFENETGDIQFQVKEDTNDQYLNCLYNQLKEGIYPSLEHFFEKSFDFIKKCSTNESCFSQELMEVTQKLFYSLRSSQEVDQIDIKLFQQKRYMLTDKEYIYYFIFNEQFTFDKLFIITNRVNSILTSEIFDAIKKISMKKPVILIYDSTEFNANKTINYYLDSEKGNKNLVIIKSENIEDTRIFFAPFLEIHIEEKILHVFNKDISYKTGIMNFEYNKGNLNEILSKFDIEP